MKLNDLDFIKLLPQFMQDDAAVRGLAAGLDSLIPGLADAIERLSTWDHIDDLSEKELDELAWELNISWYDTTASIDIKRDLIKNSDKIYKHLGTKWAVETVIQIYFGAGSIEEWFEYDGEPGHFRVLSPNPSLSDTKLADFMNILGKVKRASAKLDDIIITLSGEVILSAGMAIHDSGSEQYAIGATLA